MPPRRRCDVPPHAVFCSHVVWPSPKLSPDHSWPRAPSADLDSSLASYAGVLRIPHIAGRRKSDGSCADRVRQRAAAPAPVNSCHRRAFGGRRALRAPATAGREIRLPAVSASGTPRQRVTRLANVACEIEEVDQRVACRFCELYFTLRRDGSRVGALNPSTVAGSVPESDAPASNQRPLSSSGNTAELIESRGGDPFMAERSSERSSKRSAKVGWRRVQARDIGLTAVALEDAAVESVRLRAHAALCARARPPRR